MVERVDARMTKGAQMQAKIGDRMVAHGAHVGDVPRDGEIIEVHGANGGPPYLVRWSDNGHESLVFPGPGMQVVHPATPKAG